MWALNTGREFNTGRGSDVIELIEAGGFYSRKYGIQREPIPSTGRGSDVIVLIIEAGGGAVVQR